MPTSDSFIKKNENPHFTRNGYIPLEGQITQGQIDQEDNSGAEVDTLKIDYLEKIISLCKQQNARLILVTSPWFLKTSDYDMSAEVLQNLVLKHKIEFYNYSQDSLFLSNQGLFTDIGHLNHNGAMLFSEIVTTRIKCSSSKF